MSDPVWVVIPAGGRGVRAGLPVPKQYMDIGGVSVLERTVCKVASVPGVAGVVVALPPVGQDPLPQVEQARKRLAGMGTSTIPVLLVPGGETRQESVYQALKAVPSEVPWIAVHDASRPFFSLGMFARVVQAAFSRGAAVCGVPPVDTVKSVRVGDTQDTLVEATLDRGSHVGVQTPQVFAGPLIREAHEAALRDGFTGTDDSQLVERLGHEVVVVPGERANFKLTYPEDFAFARTQVTGLGFDVHPLTPGRKCVIGGVDIPFEMGLLGHSDADVLCHAVMDAILGALGKGDIGQWFPDDDPRFEGASSIGLLAGMWDDLKASADFVNVDAVVIAEAPKIMPHAAKIRANIARALLCSPEQVSVKATTAERLGTLGRGEGIAAFCVVTLRKMLR
ncbi:MAG: 2-C-methyl-D-erythritol 4-phosphate cytidylyltransferase [Bacillota bacterium]